MSTKSLQITHDCGGPQGDEPGSGERAVIRVTGGVGGEAKPRSPGSARPRRARALRRSRRSGAEQVQLLRPGRAVAGDRHHAAALGDRLGLGGDRRPGAPRPGRLDGRERGRGRRLRRAPRRARRRAGGAVAGDGSPDRLTRPRPGRIPPSAITRPSRIAELLARALRRELGGSVAVISAWPPPASSRSHRRCARVRVELGGDVVEQHQRRRAALVEQDLALGEQQRQEAPGAARPASRSGAARGRRGESASSSRWGPWVVKPRSRSESPALGQLGRELLGASRPRCAAGRRASASPSRPRSSAPRRRTGRRAPRRPRHGSPSARLRPPPARRPRHPASPRGRPPSRIRPEQRVALRERTAVAPARLRPRRPQRRAEAVEVGAAGRRRALDQHEPVRHEHRERGAQLGAAAASTARPSTWWRRSSPRSIAHGRCGPPAAPSATSTSTRASGCAERDRLAVGVSCAASARRAPGRAPRAGSSCRRRSAPTAA